MSRLLEQYKNQIKQDLKSKLGLKNVFEVPKIEKIIITWMLPLQIGFISEMDEWYLFITIIQLDIMVCPVEERSEAASSKRDGAFWGTEILKPGIWNPISLNGIIFKKLVEFQDVL